MRDAGGPALRRLAVACEVLHPPWDEGIRIVASRVAAVLGDRTEVLALSERDGRIGTLEVHGALSNRWFIAADLRRRIRSFAPQAVLYVPWTSLTARTIVRSRVLARYAGAPVACLALQPREAGLAARLASVGGGPAVVMTCGPGALRQARSLGFDVAEIPLGVDLDRFRPPEAEERRRLRARAGLEDREFVVLHVGHLKASRNVGVLEACARLPGVRVLLVASTSTTVDRECAARLHASGVLVMTHHQDRIEKVYQCADAYLFPVRSRLDAIEMPLSVLEAAACNLACITTRFGGLPALLGEARSGLAWVQDDAQCIEAVREMAVRRGSPETRKAVETMSWQATGARILEVLEARVREDRGRAGAPAGRTA